MKNLLRRQSYIKFCLVQKKETRMEKHCSSSKKYKTLFTDTAAFTISNFASKILVFLLLPLYTAILSTEEYGIADLITNTVNVVYPILTLNDLSES